MTSRNIVIAPCGNKSLLFQQGWLKQAEKREFELCLLFYHEKIEHPERYEQVDHFFHLKDFKYHMLHKLLTEVHPEWLDKYDHFYFLDDDIEIDTNGINRMFALSKAFESDISQACLSRDSFCSWPMFKQASNSYCRYVGQIEVMAPLFRAEALRLCLPSFIGNRSSWGVDSVWSKILGYPEDKLVVFDTVVMKHTLPVGGGELYQKIGVDPHVEWTSIANQFGAKKNNYIEYGRLQLVNKNSNRLKFGVYKAEEAGRGIKRRWNDYDVMSRVRNRTGKLFGKRK